jgi:hypothetical protein
MDKEFVPYEPSLALKELGFDEPCLTYYFSDGAFNDAAEEDDTLHPGDPRFYSDTNSSLAEYRENELKYKAISAPTFSQAFRFFREKYNLDIDISRNDQKMIDYVERKGEKYLPKYSYGYSNGTFIRIGTCMKYEEAELACLLKLIEIVKEKKNG